MLSKWPNPFKEHRYAPRAEALGLFVKLIDFQRTFASISGHNVVNVIPPDTAISEGT